MSGVLNVLEELRPRTKCPPAHLHKEDQGSINNGQRACRVLSLRHSRDVQLQDTAEYSPHLELNLGKESYLGTEAPSRPAFDQPYTQSKGWPRTWSARTIYIRFI